MLPEYIMVIFVFLIAACIGSFLNVCIYRLPRELSLVSPPSSCPGCGRAIPFYENIPIFGYIFLAGKCRGCKEPISLMYPAVESLTAAIGVLLYLKYGLAPELGIYFVFCCALVVISFIDLELQIIPNSISIPGIPVGIGASFFVSKLTPLDSLIGALVGGGVLLVVALGYYFIMKKEGMGGGDIKLLAMIGAFLGWQSILFVLFFSSLTGAVVGIIYAAKSGKSTREPIPFGPFLSLGALFYVFIGERVISYYTLTQW